MLVREAAKNLLGSDLKAAFYEALSKAIHINEQFSRSISVFEDQNIKDELLNIPKAISASLQRIKLIVDQNQPLQQSLINETNRAQKTIDSKIDFIEEIGIIYFEKNIAVEWLGKISDAYFNLKYILEPEKSVKIINEDFTWYDHKLRLEQKIVNETVAIELDLKHLLQNIKGIADNNLLSPNICFISYAWPAEDSEQEKWVQPFLVNFRKHLRYAGINAKLDIKDSVYGGNIYDYMDKILDAECVILVCTESLLKKHKSGVHAICNELILINKKRTRKSLKTLPILLSGSFDTSIPHYLSMYTNIMDWRKISYLQNLKTILASIYGFHLENSQYNNMWLNFELKYQFVMQGITEQDVAEQIAKEREILHDQKKIQAEQISKIFAQINTANTKQLENGEYLYSTQKSTDNSYSKETMNKHFQFLDSIGLFTLGKPPFSEQQGEQILLSAKKFEQDIANIALNYRTGNNIYSSSGIEGALFPRHLGESVKNYVGDIQKIIDPQRTMNFFKNPDYIQFSDQEVLFLIKKYNHDQNSQVLDTIYHFDKLLSCLEEIEYQTTEQLSKGITSNAVILPLKMNRYWSALHITDHIYIIDPCGSDTGLIYKLTNTNVINSKIVRQASLRMKDKINSAAWTIVSLAYHTKDKSMPMGGVDINKFKFEYQEALDCANNRTTSSSLTL